MNRPSLLAQTVRITLAVMLVLTLGQGLSIAGQQANRAFEPLRMISGFVSRLNLTPEQRAQVRVVLETHRVTLTALVERETLARAARFQTIHQADVNEPAVRIASRAVADVDADLAVERAAIFSELAPILTVEQKSEIAAFTERVRSVVQSELEHAVGPRAGLNRLKLSDEQRAAIRAILESHASSLETLAAEELETRSALVAAIRQQEIDETAVRAASEAVAAVDVELSVERAEIFAEIEDTLTPEQLAKLASVQERLRQALEDRGELAFTIGMRLLV